MSTTTEKKYESRLYKFAIYPKYNDAIAHLAENITDKEDWDFSDHTVKKYSILKNYLEHTYRRLEDEKKILFTSGNKFACFNTGLVTENFEDIFAFYEKYIPNKKNKGLPAKPFCFKAFVKKSDSRFLKHFSNSIPELANYFEDPSALIFNPKCQLIPDIDHIIEDNIARFPPHLQGASKEEINMYLFGAIDAVKKRVRTNYKIAVPQYYGGKIQLLLPLLLTHGSSNPDLALVVTRLNEDTYTARTCLTLKMAYNNARLIVKPQSSWLKP